MDRWIWTVVLAAIALAGCGRGTASRSRPRVLIISVDGLRPDLLLRNKTPAMHHMMDTGSYSMWARTTEISITLPSHTSMLTGVTPLRHDVWWNEDIPKLKEHPPAVPSIFELAKQHGYTTGMAVGKSKFETLMGPRHKGDANPVDWAYIPAEQMDNLTVAREAVRIIEDHRPEVMFVHFPDVDKEGHANRWGSDAQRKAVETADRGVGMVLDCLRREGLLEQTVVILSADHGGSGNTHGKEDYRSRHIPWIACGPGVKRNQDLTTIRELLINTEDTFGTAAWLLGIPLDEDLEGKPITQAFVEPQGRQLVTAARK